MLASSVSLSACAGWREGGRIEEEERREKVAVTQLCVCGGGGTTAFYLSGGRMNVVVRRAPCANSYCWGKRSRKRGEGKRCYIVVCVGGREIGSRRREGVLELQVCLKRLYQKRMAHGETIILCPVSAQPLFSRLTSPPNPFPLV